MPAAGENSCPEMNRSKNAASHCRRSAYMSLFGEPNLLTLRLSFWTSVVLAAVG